MNVLLPVETAAILAGRGGKRKDRGEILNGTPESFA
jgi:hypothetical protein